MSAVTPTPSEKSAFAVASRKSKRVHQWLAANICFLCAIIGIATTIGIVIILVKESIPFFRDVPIWQFLTGTKWTPMFVNPQFGVLPLISGTVLITIGAAIIAIPLGVLTAVYLSEYAHPKVKQIVKPALELLAGIPTVVYGYLGIFLVTPILQRIFGVENVSPYNAAAGAIVVGIMILPLVSSLCEDAISSVPKALRDAALGLGSTKVEAVWKIVLPSALSGIMAAFILAISRAVGETMAVTLAAGATPNLTLNPFASVQTMTAYIVTVSKGDAAVGTTAYNTIYAVGITLFAMTLVMNILAIRLVKRFRQAY
ncbi:MAG: phosphate ABC transporter permease subunit PstC [Fimbriimonadaceae bacterium]